MTSDDSLSLILRRLDEIERKLDHMLEELRTLNTPTAIGYSVRRGNLPKKEQIFGADEPRTGGKATKKHSAQRDAERKGPNSTSSRSANLPRPSMAGAFFSPD
jgi:hypothetical protein